MALLQECRGHDAGQEVLFKPHASLFLNIVFHALLRDGTIMGSDVRGVHVGTDLAAGERLY